ncbi:MAG: HlyC/CorC family transporter [Candidatus Omnitrophica bacterium]|nr:HlyC/CorC family transporter [Candidatus Omnitrophota bacterium]
MVISFVLLVVFISFSFFFSASETAIFSLTKTKFRRLKEKYVSAKELNIIFRNPGLFLSTIVFGNMLVNIGLASLTTYVFVDSFGNKGIIFSIVFSGLVLLFFGEVFPKTLAIYAYERISLASAPLLIFISRILSPGVRLIQKIVDTICYSFLKKEKKFSSEEDIKEALFLGKKEGYITEAEEEMISYVLEFKETWANEVLTPRVDIKGIEIESSQEEIISIFKKERHSKFPVYRESLDNIIGVVYAKDVFLNPKHSWKEFIRESVFVPESKKIDDLLREFLEKGERIAIVLDEYGGTEGLVTLEDVKEEIFGEIYDEFEVPLKMIDKLQENEWIVYGKTPIKILNSALELNLPEDSPTLAGFILSKLERIPHSRERFEFEGLEFIVQRATAKRIISVVIKLKR